jgi:NAD(P)-dependent dehydrogenase (short-subunit alcohol dehydrogenase family)
MKIAQSIIIITAAGSPISKAIAVHLASLGATLALVDTNISSLKSTYEACHHLNNRCYTFHIPDMKQATIEQLFTTISLDVGEINVLINAWPNRSGIPHLLEPNAIDVFSDVMEKGATTFFTFGKIASKFMPSTFDHAVIINLALNQSKHQLHTPDASKCVVQGLTQSWAQDLETVNIRVGGIIPIIASMDSSDDSTMINIALQYEIVRSTEYIISNDSFNGRMLEAEVSM